MIIFFTKIVPTTIIYHHDSRFVKIYWYKKDDQNHEKPTSYYLCQKHYKLFFTIPRLYLGLRLCYVDFLYDCLPLQIAKDLVAKTHERENTKDMVCIVWQE